MHHSQLPKDVESLKRYQYLCCSRLKIAQPRSFRSHYENVSHEIARDRTRSVSEYSSVHSPVVETVRIESIRAERALYVSERFISREREEGAEFIITARYDNGINQTRGGLRVGPSRTDRGRRYSSLPTALCSLVCRLRLVLSPGAPLAGGPGSRQVHATRSDSKPRALQSPHATHPRRDHRATARDRFPARL
jgi:hypothetical protein